MLDFIAAVVLSPGVKGFFEDPRYLLGLPLAALGLGGLLIAMSPVELKWPQPQPQQPEAEIIIPHGAEGHPGPAEYLMIGGILAVITIVEVAIYYIDVGAGVLNTLLIVLSGLKFVLVVLWFMHLKFDNKLFSVFFSSALALVLALFVVVLTSLGAGLV